MSKEKIRVTSRNYASWLLWMGFLVLIAVLVRKYLLICLILMVIMTVIFFAVKETEILRIDDRTICFNDGERKIEMDKDDLISFAYLNNDNNKLKIVYRDKGEEKTAVLSTYNMIDVHRKLDQLFPEKNSVREEYEIKMAENKKANEEYFQRIKNKIADHFRK